MDIVTQKDLEDVIGEFYVDDRGVSLTGTRALARLIGVSPSLISKTIERVLTNNSVKWLEPLRDEIISCSLLHPGKFTEPVVVAFVSHYSDKGRKAAKVAAAAMLQAGYRKFVHSITGWEPKSQLQMVLEHVLTDACPWEKCFPDMFFEQYMRMSGNRRHSIHVGAFINRYIYGYFAAELRDVLSMLNPHDPEFKRIRRLHQHLSMEFKQKALIPHIWMVIGMMKGCESSKEFRELYKEQFPERYQDYSDHRKKLLTTANTEQNKLQG